MRIKTLHRIPPGVETCRVQRGAKRCGAVSSRLVSRLPWPVSAAQPGARAVGPSSPPPCVSAAQPGARAGSCRGGARDASASQALLPIRVYNSERLSESTILKVAATQSRRPSRARAAAARQAPAGRRTREGAAEKVIGGSRQGWLRGRVGQVRGSREGRGSIDRGAEP